MQENGHADNVIEQLLAEQRRFHDAILNLANAANWTDARYNYLRDTLAVMRIEMEMLLRGPERWSETELEQKKWFRF